MICGSSWFQSRLFFCLERFERVFRLPALNGRSRPKPTIKTKARDCAQKVELVGYRRTNEPAPAFASQIVVRAICAELYRSFDKFLEQTALGFSSDILTTDIADFDNRHCFSYDSNLDLHTTDIADFDCCRCLLTFRGLAVWIPSP